MKQEREDFSGIYLPLLQLCLLAFSIKSQQRDTELSNFHPFAPLPPQELSTLLGDVRTQKGSLKLCKKLAQ
jgi:hypothetical protein